MIVIFLSEEYCSRASVCRVTADWLSSKQQSCRRRPVCSLGWVGGAQCVLCLSRTRFLGKTRARSKDICSPPVRSHLWNSTVTACESHVSVIPISFFQSEKKQIINCHRQISERLGLVSSDDRQLFRWCDYIYCC